MKQLANSEDRPDFKFITNLIQPNQRVLDLGCGDGKLLYFLKQKGVKGQGIEKDEDCIHECIKNGVYVHHGDIDEGLGHHEDKRFDYVILNQTIQETRNPGLIIKETLRIGKKSIIVFPNFGFYKIRMNILFTGKKPITELMPNHWYDTPNLHFLSVNEFFDFCKITEIKVEKTAFFSDKKNVILNPNFFSKLALFVIYS